MIEVVVEATVGVLDPREEACARPPRALLGDPSADEADEMLVRLLLADLSKYARKPGDMALLAELLPRLLHELLPKPRILKCVPERAE